MRDRHAHSDSIDVLIAAKADFPIGKCDAQFWHERAKVETGITIFWEITAEVFTSV